MESKILNNAINRAAMLMNDKRFNAIVENTARKGVGTSRKQNEFSHLENIAFGAPVQTNQTINDVSQINESTLPSVIKDSFFQKQQTPIQQINESYLQQPIATSGINYEIIKALIDESISRHLNEIKNALITENANTMRGFKFSDGNKITFVDKRGNIFEGKLELKKAKK